MGTFADLFARLDPDPRVRGKQFEHVCKWFLENDSRFRHLAEVWLWDDWPGNWGIDTGVDLVARDDEGNFWAIQAKAYKDTYWIPKAAIDSFLSDSNREAISHRLLIATTDRVGHHTENTMNNQEKPVTFVGLSKLETAEINWPASPSDLQAEPLPPKEPLDHQIEAIDAVVGGFAESARGQMIMACGTGKTLTSLFIKEKLGADRTLVLAPSLSLLSQLLIDWKANATTGFTSLPVCSDETVGQTDAIVVSASELGDVTTNPQEIADFLRKKGPRVVFSTYQSCPEIAEAFRLGGIPEFDLVVADEAHRTTGPATSPFTTVLSDEKIKAKRRLFMTATPRYFTGRVIREAAELDFEVASMDDEAVYGPVFHRLPFSEAIERGLLTDYQVVVVGVDDVECREMADKARFVSSDGIANTDARTLAAQIGLGRTMSRYDLRRSISFHSRVKSAQQFSLSLPEVIGWLPADQRPSGGVWADHVHGEMTANQRRLRLRELGNVDQHHRGLLSNARCLTEGVDVPTLDGVVFVDPKRSEVDIVQAVGRAIRKAEDKTVGTIVIPVFVSTSDDPKVVLDDSTFKTVWDVVRALRMHDEVLAEQLDSLRLEMGLRGEGPPRLPEKIHLDLPIHVGADFALAFDVRLVNSVTASFEELFGVLKQYVEENGDALVPKKFTTTDGVKLGNFVDRQRMLKIKGRLSSERISRLASVPGWEWDVLEAWWMENYRVCREYVAETGVLPVFKAEFRGVKIGKWCNKQRTAKKRGSLSGERVELLDAIDGWWWNGRDAWWEAGLLHTEEVAAREGTTRVPQTYLAPDGHTTGQWIFSQRDLKKKGKLSDERTARLDAIDGWEWDVSLDARWLEKYALYKEWSAEHGHVLPRSLALDGKNVGQWVSNQRAAKRREKLSDEKIRLLAALNGWDWEPKAKGYYTTEEDEIILQSTSLKDLYRLLPNRSEDALKLRRSTLRAQQGLSTPPKPYTPEEDEIIGRGGSLKELGDRLDRTVASVRNRRYVLTGKRRRGSHALSQETPKEPPSPGAILGA